MLNFIGGGLGVLVGLAYAWRRGGNRLDLLQYGAVFAIIGFLMGTLAMFILPPPG
ncbi:hypothetical protein KUL25_07125 [Rhodobacteraceae bacterium N5(2021)]|uniref:Uncharacterized protein n=1 Tax=Gymnodinialimonas phycosphaerae TaxID=2841589 RepID=A0A975TXX5_9RHOB|nr:hypothetical protein [Gymnodinialimonas phycosphaerae]MBY4892533.1 hypothetical protein [Gymnodinialimonas phycosphaerae]